MPRKRKYPWSGKKLKPIRVYRGRGLTPVRNAFPRSRI